MLLNTLIKTHRCDEYAVFLRFSPKILRFKVLWNSCSVALFNTWTTAVFCVNKFVLKPLEKRRSLRRSEWTCCFCFVLFLTKNFSTKQATPLIKYIPFVFYPAQLSFSRVFLRQYIICQFKCTKHNEIINVQKSTSVFCYLHYWNYKSCFTFSSD